MNCYIYEIKNKLTDETFIGIRYCECKAEEDKFKGEETSMETLYKKYGKKSFEKNILAKVISEESKSKLFKIYLKDLQAIEITDKKVVKKGDVIGGKVICLTTGEIFDNAEIASQYANVSRSIVTRACNPKHPTGIAGKHPETKEPLEWMYLSIYEAKEQGEDIPERIGSRKKKKIVRVDNGEVFESILEASKKYGVHSGTICTACDRKSLTAGVDPDNGMKLKWMYYDTYIKSNKPKK